MTTAPHAVALDIETTGLSPTRHSILEVGIVTVDESLTQVDAIRAVLVSESSRYWSRRALADAGRGTTDYVQQMHVDNGLAAEIVAWPGKAVPGTWYLTTLPAMEQDLINWLRERSATGYPMVGSSIGSLDRPFLQEKMPELNAVFSYRNADVSGVLEVIKILDIDRGTRMREQLGPQPAAHRTIEDALDSIRALSFIGTELGIHPRPVAPSVN